MARLNLKQIEEIQFLESTTDEEIFTPLITIYEQQSLAFINKMLSLNEAKEYNNLSRVAHSFKSSASHLGLQTVAELCLKIEIEGRRNPKFNFSETLSKLTIESEYSLLELKVFLKSKVNTVAA